MNMIMKRRYRRGDSTKALTVRECDRYGFVAEFKTLDVVIAKPFSTKI